MFPTDDIIDIQRCLDRNKFLLSTKNGFYSLTIENQRRKFIPSWQRLFEQEFTNIIKFAYEYSEDQYIVCKYNNTSLFLINEQTNVIEEIPNVTCHEGYLAVKQISNFSIENPYIFVKDQSFITVVDVIKKQKFVLVSCISQ